MIRYDFEEAAITFEESRHGRLVVRFRDGRIKDYGNPSVHHWEKTWQCVEAVGTGASPAMPRWRFR
ncbi:MAG: hypothetical protein FJ224_01835 [Lentisphaerae bacterium]|nr:hypothetical protein [Lentisphaerota bacterium]